MKCIYKSLLICCLALAACGKDSSNPNAAAAAKPVRTVLINQEGEVDKLTETFVWTFAADDQQVSLTLYSPAPESAYNLPYQDNDQLHINVLSCPNAPVCEVYYSFSYEIKVTIGKSAQGFDLPPTVKFNFQDITYPDGHVEYRDPRKPNGVMNVGAPGLTAVQAQLNVRKGHALRALPAKVPIFVPQKPPTLTPEVIKFCNQFSIPEEHIKCLEGIKP